MHEQSCIGVGKTREGKAENAKQQRAGAEAQPFGRIAKEKMAEEWRAVIGYEGTHEVSNHGRIRKRDGTICTQSLTGKYSKCGRGYLASYVSSKSPRCIKLHRAVALAFIPNPNGLPQVNHKNGITTDNYVDNLEWCTASYNQRHAIENGLKVPLFGEDVGTAKFTREQMDAAKAAMMNGEPVRSVARRTGISRTHLKRLKRGETWKHI